MTKKHFLNLAGLPYRPSKQMGHTFASLALAAGDHLEKIQPIHVIPNLTRRDGSALEKYMADGFCIILDKKEIYGIDFQS